MFLDYLKPIKQDVHIELNKLNKYSIGNKMLIHSELLGLPKLDGVSIAFLGIEESRGSKKNKGTARAVEFIRREFYKLQYGNWKLKLADLGNLKVNRLNEKEMYQNLTKVISSLIESNIVPILVGGTQALTYAMYRAYDKVKKNVTLCVLDSKFDLGSVESHIHSENYLSHIIMRKPNNLFNYKNLGYQTYFINQEEINLLDKMNFDIHRLGEVTEDITISESVLRDTDMVSFDISCVRASDAPANENISPNGFYGEEVCAVTRYAGTSNQVSSFGFFEYNPLYDEKGQTAKLIAQGLWYFIEGYSNRTIENPSKKGKNYTHYTVPIVSEGLELHFVKSNITTKWWIKIDAKSKIKYLPCRYNDYLLACEAEIPEVWYKVQKRYL